nr:MAG: hypothetical protein [Smacoviridae sp.]
MMSDFFLSKFGATRYPTIDDLVASPGCRYYDSNAYFYQSFFGGMIQPLGAFYNARDSSKYMSDYLRNTGLTYRDIKYPTRTAGYSAGSSLGSSVLFVSSNIKRLYKE